MSPSKKTIDLVSLTDRKLIISKLSRINSASLVVVRADKFVLTQILNNDYELLNNLYRTLHDYGVLEITASPNPKESKRATDIITQAGFQKVEMDMSVKGQTILRSIKRRDKHTHDAPLTRQAFLNKCKEFKNKSSRVESVSFIITVRNEAQNLPHLLSFLDNITDETGMRREFIFVLNGCTDESEEILNRYASGSNLTIKIITCINKGILPAFKSGIAARGLDGLVGRFDADIILHPYTLDLMQMHLLDHPEVKVTYAEPRTLEPITAYNEPWHKPSIISKRLYYIGKTSLYRRNPFTDSHILKRPDSIIADDIFTSFYFVYYFGFEAISRTPHAIVYEKVAATFPDLVKQLSRVTSEIKRIFTHYPEFKILNFAMEQELYPSSYQELTLEASKQTTYSEEWLRLESTK